MSHEEKKQAIEEYIASREGKATLNDVADHMNRIEPMSLRTSWMTTRALIRGLEEAGRIKLTRAERRGQSHRLSIDDSSEFNKINEELASLEKHIGKLQIPKAVKPLDIPKEEAIMLKLLFHLAMSKKFPLKDYELLEKKILKLMLAIYVKKVRSMRGVEAMAVLKNDQKASKS